MHVNEERGGYPVVTFSLCMIVKNEERVLARCLDSLAPLMDEIIIVDTGSTDKTKSIAAKYTDKIYDFTWVDDFAAARNFSCSKATCDYIYVADADEYVSPENVEHLHKLKQCILPEIDIVQMHYITKVEFNTVENFSDELRPKLFKRLREFLWVDPIHETVSLTPIVFDSDICIEHLPESLHSERDFDIFCKSYKRDGNLSDRIGKMWATELLKCGDISDFSNSVEYFEGIYYNKLDSPIYNETTCVLARFYRISNDTPRFFSIVLKYIVANNVSDTCSEICYELGEYYRALDLIDDAAMWYYNCIHETRPILDIGVCKNACLALAKCYEVSGMSSEAEEFRKKASEYELL